MDKEVKLFSESKCQLGEGGCWHRQRESFFWVDILEGRVFEKSLQGDARHWDLNCFTSAVFEIENDSENLWVLSDKGLLRLSLGDAGYKIFHPLLGINDGMRTNDAGIDPGGNLVYGTMYCDSQEGVGALYRLNANGTIDILISDVRIPNTFQWSANGRYLYNADSYKGSMFRYSYENGLLVNQTEFFTLDAAAGIVPDGSTLDIDGFLWSACWNGSAVHRYDPDGVMVEKVSIPVSRPTSCAFGDDGELFITSASIDMSAKQLQQEPLAGSVLLVQTSHRGAPRPYLRFDA